MGQGLYGEDGWSCGTLDGIAGAQATAVEVEQRGQLAVCELGSPLGVWVAAFNGHEEATVRVLAGDRTIFEYGVSPEAT
jgi:hypothetical protein